jgi:AraC family ethanolamine operon transcriptional activator
MTPPGSAGRIETHDIEACQEIVDPWDVILRQQSPGSFHGRMDYVQVNGLLIYRENWSRSVLASGTTPAGYFMLGTTLIPEKSTSWCGGDLSTSKLAFAFPGSETDFITPDDACHTVILVPEFQMLSAFGEEAIDAALVQNQHHLACNTHFGCRHRLIARMDRLISEYLVHPERLMDPHECEAIELQLMGDLAEIFPGDGTDGQRVTRSQRRRAFFRAVKMGDELTASITVPELAAAAGVSQRVLELAFHESTGVSPRKYLRWRRMQNALTDLQAGDPAATTVSKVAGHWGFTELGRFAVEYKKLFGQSPSETLRNPKPSRPLRYIDLLELGGRKP